jgi:transposase-like protein
MPRTATIESLAVAFAMMKAMRADGLEWGGNYRLATRRLLTCLRYESLEERKMMRATNAAERRPREVRRRTRSMGTFQDRTSMERILFALFTHENHRQGLATPFPL